MATCVVCHDPVHSTKPLCAATCGHVLHHTCWIQWLKRSSNCPECRRTTTEEDLIRLYLYRECTDELVDPMADSLPFKMQGLNIKDKPKSVTSEQPEVIDLVDSEEDESNEEVIVSDDTEDSDSSLGLEEGSRSKTDTSASESEISDELGNKDSSSDESGSEDSSSDESGSEDSSGDESVSEDSSGDEIESEDSLSDESGCDEDEGPEIEESGSYETSRELENEICEVNIAESTDSDRSEN